MAQTLKLNIIVDDHGAVQVLRAFDGAVDRSTKTVKGGTHELDQYGIQQVQLVDKTQKSTGATDQLTASFRRYLSVAAILGAIKATLDYAGSLEKMRASTGIGVTGLQQLENIAIGSNTSFQALTSSVLDLQRRLATGDDSAAAAMRTLRIDTKDFLALRGDEQFLILARSLGAMTNETDRNKLAFQLFGRAYKEILSALVGDVDGLKDSFRTMSEEGVNASARLLQAFQNLFLFAKRGFGELTGAIGSAFDLAHFVLDRPTLPPPPPAPGPGAEELGPAGLSFFSPEKTLRLQLELLTKQLEIDEKRRVLKKQINEIERSGVHWLTMMSELQGMRLGQEVNVLDTIAASTRWMEQQEAIRLKTLADEEAFLATLQVQERTLQRQVGWGEQLLGLATQLAGFKMFGDEGWFGWAPVGAHAPIRSLSSVGQPGDSWFGSGTFTPPSFAAGGPTREGLAFVHDDEFVVPKGGALVSGGARVVFSAGAFVFNYPIMTDARAMDELGRVINQAIGRRLRDSGTRL